MALSDRLRRRFLREHIRAGEYHERSENWQEAVNCYEAGLRVDPCAEDICRRLMKAYQRLGRPAEMAAIYNSLKEALRNRLGTSPSAETEGMLKSLWARQSR